ncbi:MAG: hypothetical protein LBV66_03490 [Elusimicrobiota bacterium]|jgi:hypothetical protein|nr:hypothetical protein [Elusimicrobiota bacterium]
MKNKINFISKINLVVLSAIFCIIALFFHYQREKDLQKFSISQAQEMIQLNLNSINSAISSSDDLRLFSLLESLSKTKSILSCFITDKDAKIILHNDISRVGSQNKGEKYVNALGKKAAFLQKGESKGFFLYSIPVANGNTLFALISTNTLKIWKLLYIIFALILAFLLTAAFYFALKKFILIPFEKTRTEFEQGRIDEGDSHRSEVSDILIRERRKSEKVVNLLKANELSLTVLIEYFCKEYSKDLSVFIVLNSFNNIVFAYDKTGKILKDASSIGKNIVEQVVNPDLLNAVSQSNDNPNAEIKTSINDLTLKVLTILKDKEVSGTIILSEQ